MYRYTATQRWFLRLKFAGHKVKWRYQGTEMTIRQVQETLCGYGFPCGRADGKIGGRTEFAIRMFQIAFNGGRADLPLLVVDGVWGPKTRRALWEFPYLSPHFTALEVASRGNGDAYVKRELLMALELERAELGRPLRLASVYRDPEHNAKVGGAKNSRHLYGEAADISRRYNLLLDDVKAKMRYSGIGYLRRSKRCTHLDVRHTSGVGSVVNPRTWRYPE